MTWSDSSFDPIRKTRLFVLWNNCRNCGTKKHVSNHETFRKNIILNESIVTETKNIYLYIFRIIISIPLLKLLELFACTLMLPATFIMIF